MKQIEFKPTLTINTFKSLTATELLYLYKNYKFEYFTEGNTIKLRLSSK